MLDGHELERNLPEKDLEESRQGERDTLMRHAESEHDLTEGLVDGGEPQTAPRLKVWQWGERYCHR